MKKLLCVFAWSALLGGGLFANGQKEAPPVIPLAAQPTVFLAPANPDAAQKALTLPFAAQAGAGAVLKAWTFSVYDSSGRLVWQSSQADTRDRGFFGELFNLGDKPAVTLPAQLVWDGTWLIPEGADGDKTQNGKPVPNGVYTYLLTVTDSAGQTSRTPPFTVSIQNAPVRITRLAVDYAIFSPRGKRSTLTVHQDGTRETKWQGEFADASGKVVRTLVWENPTDQATADVTPPDFDWDGKDDAGQILPEGDYKYTLKGTNRAGAAAVQTLDSAVVISERPGVLRLASDQAVFSPRADKGWPTTLTWKPDSGNAEGLVDWTVTVSDAGHPKVALWTKAGKGALPDALSFDGKDQLGRELPEGHYQAVLSANFNNGNAGESPAFAFDIDTTAPRGTLQTAQTVFGGTGRPTLAVDFAGDGNLTWTLELQSADGKSLRNWPLGDVGKSTAEISGVDGAGKPLADGTYTLRATTHDKAGNKGLVDLTVTKDTRAMKVALNPSSPILVPGNVSNGSITVTPVLDVADSVVSTAWSLSVLDAKGAARQLDEKLAPAVAPYVWSGRDDAGKPLADGNYRVALSVTYANGTVSTAQRDLRVDSNYLKEPQGTLTLSAPIFGGNTRPTVTAKFQGDTDVTWTLELVDASGKTVGQYPLGAGTGSVDLPTGTEGTLADGVYTLKASAQSKAGVTGVVTQTVRKDSRALKVGLDLSRAVLVPGKGANAQVRITPLLDVIDSVQTTTLEVRSASGDVLASQTKDGLVTFWDWNGKDAAGKAPADGAYSVNLSVAYANGAVSKAAADLKVDSTYLTEPQGTLSVSAPVFGSASRPTVTAAFAGDAGLVWTLDVLDKTGKTVKTTSLGDTGQAVVEIGADSAGKPLPDGSYTLQASAKSKAGLTGTVTATVRKDTRPLQVALDLSTPVLVPGSNLNGSVKITPVLDVLDSITTTTLSFATPDGKVFDQRGGDGLVPFWDWDGKDALGKTQPDGSYVLTLTVAYANGAQSQARAGLKIDSTYLKEPQGSLTASDSVFGGAGRTGITVNFQGDAGLPWTLEILGADGKTVVRQALGDKGQASFNFQGLDGQGQALPDGPYTLRASAVSKAGVTGTALLQLRKDSRQAKVSLDLSRTVIVPGKGANGTVRITPLLDAVDSVDKTVLSVLGPDGKTVGEKATDGALPFWDWGGQDAKGKNLANGTYEVALTVNYANGSVSRAQGQVKIDSTYLNDQGPLVDMSLSTKTFAPNNVDGATDLTVSIKTTEGVVPVDNWQLAVIDPRGKTFRQWSGKGAPPKSVYWDGKSDTGDIVESGEDYQLQLKVADTQNHVTRKQDSVTIDISVVKVAEGKYKIVVSSIQFPGNSSDLFKVPTDIVAKNIYVLRRLANTLGKFPGYKIRLEGYAVSEFWNDPKAAAVEQTTQLIPLSLDRAQAVRNVMVLLGIDPDRFTVLGLGGEKPVVPHGDVENRWKNRRVEFYLDKN